jgi:hypothetical protein
MNAPAASERQDVAKAQKVEEQARNLTEYAHAQPHADLRRHLLATANSLREYADLLRAASPAAASVVVPRIEIETLRDATISGPEENRWIGYRCRNWLLGSPAAPAVASTVVTDAYEEAISYLAKVGARLEQVFSEHPRCRTDEDDALIDAAKAVIEDFSDTPAQPEIANGRAAQSSAVMPLIGGLLDEWDECPFKSELCDEPLGKYLSQINDAMEHREAAMRGDA